MSIAKQWLDAFKLEYKELFYPYFYMGSMPQVRLRERHASFADSRFRYRRIVLYYRISSRKNGIDALGATIHKYQFEEHIDFKFVI